jgi:hypothetical protein
MHLYNITVIVKLKHGAFPVLEVASEKLCIYEDVQLYTYYIQKFHIKLFNYEFWVTADFIKYTIVFER